MKEIDRKHRCIRHTELSSGDNQLRTCLELSTTISILGWWNDATLVKFVIKDEVCEQSNPMITDAHTDNIPIAIITEASGGWGLLAPLVSSPKSGVVDLDLGADEVGLLGSTACCRNVDR